MINNIKFYIALNNITLSSFNEYSYKNLKEFLLSSIDTINNLIINTSINIYFIEFINYFFLIILTVIFSLLYNKNELNNSVIKIIKFLEIGFYCFIIYFMYYVVFINNKLSFWFVNFFDLYNNINVYIIILFVIFLITIFSNLFPIIKTINHKISPETLILIQLVCCFGWTLLEINNYALFIICLEGFSLTLYILATVSRLYGNITASIKYFIFGTLGSILLYWGVVLIYEISASVDINFIVYIFENGLQTNNILLDNSTLTKLILSCNLIIVGFLIKLGAAPFHQWIPDVYSGVPMFITAFYSIIVKIFLFILFLKYAMSFLTLKEIEYASILSTIIGCFGTLRQTEIKRFLAYGSITHTGYLLIGDLSSIWIYLVTYMLATILIFLILLNIKINGKELIYLSDIRFINQSSSILDRTLFTIILASMAGLPPFAGFYGKMFVWMSLIEDIYLYNDIWSFILLITNLVLALIVIFYYMQILCILFINDESNINDINISTISNSAGVGCLNQNIRFKFIQILGCLVLTFSIFGIPGLLTL